MHATAATFSSFYSYGVRVPRQGYLRGSLNIWLLLLPLLLLTTAHASGPVLIELFTSEGCSSCPPADSLLSQLSTKTIGGAELIVLGEHVDYWDHQGWKDRFSSPIFTERQNQYTSWMHLRSPYTPQMVIDGRVDVLGNDPKAVAKRITDEAERPKSAAITLHWDNEHKLHVSAQLPSRPGVSLVLAISEDDLTTSVGGGENTGRTLHHTAVVRELRVLGKPQQGAFDSVVGVQPHGDWQNEKLKIVVFVQDSHNGDVIGVASIPYQELGERKHGRAASVSTSGVRYVTRAAGGQIVR